MSTHPRASLIVGATQKSMHSSVLVGQSTAVIARLFARQGRPIGGTSHARPTVFRDFRQALVLQVDPAGRLHSQLGAVLKVSFLFDVGLVGFDCLYADFQEFGNFAGAGAMPNQLKNLQLSRGEAFEYQVGGFAVQAFSKELRFDLGTEIVLSRQYLPDGVQNLLGRCVFGDITSGAVHQGSFGIVHFATEGANKDGEFWVKAGKSFNKLETITVTEVNSHD